MDSRHTKIVMASQLSIFLIGMFLARPTHSRHTTSDISKEGRDKTKHIVTVSSKITAGNTLVEENVNNLNDVRELSKLLQKTLQQQNIGKPGYRDHKRRTKRHGHHSKNIGQQTHTLCPVKSAITNLKEAVDMFGNTVSIYPSVHIGKIAVNQYFHETFCDKEACQCGGVDGSRYHSSCETNYSFTYARVVQQGEIGWTKILVRSGCSCVLRKKKSLKRSGNIMNSI